MSSKGRKMHAVMAKVVTTLPPAVAKAIHMGGLKKKV